MSGPHPVVSTARGPVPVAVLGRTLMHEHVFVRHSDMAADYPPDNRAGEDAAAVSTLEELRTLGIGAMVDMTVPGLGRDATRVASIAARTGLHLVLATGLYVARDLPGWFRSKIASDGPTFLEDFFVREITEGIGRSGVRAGVLKCTTDSPVPSADVEHLVRSVARAHLRTGVPISTHANAVLETGLVQQRILREEGVDLGRVVIGHAGDTDDVDHLLELLDAGSYLGMDRFGAEVPPALEARAATIARLCELGHADRLVLSHDAHCASDLTYGDTRPNWQHSYVPLHVIPALRSAGLADKEIDQMLIHNPAAVLGTRDGAAS